VYYLRLNKFFRHGSQKVLASLTTAKQIVAIQMRAKIRRTNTPVNEHSRICRDHFKAECFTKKLGSSRASVKPGSIPIKFCFVQEKEPRKPPKTRKPVKEQQKISDVFTEAAYAELAENSSKVMTSSWI